MIDGTQSPKRYEITPEYKVFISTRVVCYSEENLKQRGRQRTHTPPPRTKRRTRRDCLDSLRQDLTVSTWVLGYMQPRRDYVHLERCFKGIDSSCHGYRESFSKRV